MAAYRRVYDSRHLQADCQEPGSAPEPYTLGNRVRTTFYFRHTITHFWKALVRFNVPGRPLPRFTYADVHPNPWSQRMGIGQFLAYQCDVSANNPDRSVWHWIILREKNSQHCDAACSQITFGSHVLACYVFLPIFSLLLLLRIKILVCIKFPVHAVRSAPDIFW